MNNFSSNRTAGKNNFSINEEEDFVLGFVVKFYLLPLVLAFLIVLINGFIAWLIASEKKLHSITNKWLASLACCDFFMGFVGVPLYVSCNSTWNTPVCFTTVAVIKMISIATLLHILAITFDRYIFIVHPLKYTLILTHWRTYVAMILLWLVSSGVAATQLAWTSVDIDVSEEAEKQEEINNRIYDTSCTVIFFFIPLGFMVYAYTKIMLEVQRHCAKMKRDRIPRTAKIRKEKTRERKVIIVYLLILLLYIVGWMSYFLVYLQQSLGMKLTFEMSHDVEYCFHVLRISSSFVRPILYTIGKHDLRMSALQKLKDLREFIKGQ